MSVFVLPDLGEGLQEAEIVAWHVAAGDHVVADQPLVAVETEKAVVEVPSPRAGHIKRLCAQVGERVKVGAPLVEFEEGAHPDSGAVVGELGAPAAAAPPPKPAPAATTAAVKAVPAARARAQALGLDLAAIRPTGPGSTITLGDVEQAARAAPAPAGEALRGVRRAMALNMARSGAEVVPATVMDDADVSAWPAAADVGVRLIRAVAAGCAAAPALNAWFDGRALSRRLHRQVDLGLAVDTADGLFVPVLRDVANVAPAELRRRLDALRAAVKARSVAPAELRGATITLSNFGMLAGRYAALAIVPPQVAILGAGRLRPGHESRRLLPLSLTFDHRAATGGEAARFLAAVLADLERPD